ncbi:MAG: DUF3575 domain-containing protein [Saprospiraceae bacterium]|nr:DUF3575 domain-containing protein [Saprospiraceae bacterium]
MKIQPVLFSLAFCAFFLSSLSAQNNRYRRYDDAPEQRWSVGLAPLSLVLPSGKVNIRGEWAYASNKSLSLLVGIPRPTRMPNLLENTFDLDNEGKTLKNTYTAFGAALENRFYFGGEAPRGFYLAPYARYNHFSLARTTRGVENDYTTTFKGAVNGIGVGGALGVQFRLGSHVTMDATLAGIDFKWMRGTLTYTTNDPANDLAAFRDEVQQAVEDIPLIGHRLAAAIDGDQIKVRTPGAVLPGYRFNLSVNYVF